MFSVVSLRVCLPMLTMEVSSLVFRDEKSEPNIILDRYDPMLSQRLVKPEIAVDRPVFSDGDLEDMKLLASVVLAILQDLICQVPVLNVWRNR
jgi:hypothetical protein